jgi:two-component system C4-dicarboxylate transport sensor histidine kinase DctB
MQITRAYRDWSRVAANPDFLEASTLKAYAGLALFVGCLVGGLSAFESTDKWFNLSVGPVVVAFTVLVAGRAALLWAERSAEKGGGWMGAAILLCLATVQFFAASLMALSRYPAAAVFSSFVLLTAATHGRNARVTPSQPFVTVGLVLAMGAAYLLSRSPEHGLLFAVTTPAAVVAQWFTGSFAVAQDRAHHEAERMRVALQAQVWREQERQAGRTGLALGQLQQSSEHLKQGLVQVADALELLAALPQPGSPMLLKRLQGVREHLHRMESLVHSIESTSRRASAPPAEAVALLPVLESLRIQLAALHPDSRVDVHVEPEAEGRVSVSGGVLSLRRILENVLLNACEGDGKQCATHVRVTVGRDITGARLALTVEDNGPGFTADQLAESIAPLRSTKPKAQGLGLYTVEALVHCSGGRLERSNLPTGGARVHLLLPRADALPLPSDRAA